MVRAAAQLQIMKKDTTKADPKNVTIHTLIALKKDIYARADRRITEVTNKRRNTNQLPGIIESIQRRADYEAGRIAFVINFVNMRA
jgi:hypothetical protein